MRSSSSSSVVVCAPHAPHAPCALPRPLRTSTHLTRLTRASRTVPRALPQTGALLWASHTIGCLYYMVISFNVLEEYEVAFLNGTYAHGSRYPFNELIDASTAYDKWLLCFCWSIGMVTGLMPMDVMPSRSEEVRAQVPWWS